MFTFIKNIVGAAVIGLSLYFCLNTNTMPVLGGVIHVPSLLLVTGVTLGIAILIMDVTDGLRFARFSMALLFDKSLKETRDSEKRFEKMVEIYSKEGGEELRKQVVSEKMPRIWNIVATKLAIKIPIEDIKDILDFQIHKVASKLDQDITTLKQIAAIAPAIGMFGSVLGLIRLLGDLKDFDTLGVNMSLALITTLYGIFIGNILLVPIIRAVEKRKSNYIMNHTNLLYWLDHVDQKKPSFYMKTRLGDLDVESI
jgi:chemotaxis protein MotA